MSYHIESYSEETDPITFVCEDSECREKWQGEVETQRCDKCEIITCPTCRVDCYFCDATLCSTHRVKYNDSGNERWACAPCKAVAEARDQEEREERLQIWRAT